MFQVKCTRVNDHVDTLFLLTFQTTLAMEEDELTDNRRCISTKVSPNTSNLLSLETGTSLRQ